MPEWITFAGIRDVVLFLIAIYGAALSTFNWRQASRREKRSINVEINTITLTYPNGLGPATFQLSATNVGHRPVTVTNLYIELDRGARMFSTSYEGKLPDTQLPVTLGDGETAKLHFTYREIGEALIDSGRNKKIEITAVCLDSAGGEHKSKPLEVDPRELLTM